MQASENRSREEIGEVYSILQLPDILPEEDRVGLRSWRPNPRLAGSTHFDCFCLQEKAGTIFTWPRANDHSEACRTFRRHYPEYAEKVLPTCSKEESRAFDRLNLYHRSLNGSDDGIAAWRWRWRPMNAWKSILAPML